MKNISYKTITVLIVIILIAVNSGLLFSYYNFYLSDRLTNDIVNSKDINRKNLYDIAKKLDGKSLEEATEIIKNYANKNGGYITFKDECGTILYSNKKDSSKLFSSAMMVNIEGKNYEVIYSKILHTPGIKLVRNFMLYEIVIVSSVIIIAFFISSKTVINPIDTITKDIRNYRFGKRPYKRKMPRNMQKIQNAFVDMVDSLELEKESQNQIIASISHDIKTPLTSVIGYADRLKNKKLDNDTKEKYINKIYNKAIMMKDILEEFDDYQSCNIKETLKLNSISIGEITNLIKRDFEDELADKKIKLSIKNNCDKCNIEADLTKIKRVFSNVITNSVTHFNGTSGLIDINITKYSDVIKFEIADNGGGIKDEKNLKRIFEPLYTSNPSRKIPGLGLSICKQIISAHNGNIYAINNKIGGLSIIFILPVSFNKI